MKRKFLLLATTLAIHSAALAETQVPSLINYQGHITTSAGAVIGAGSSVNRNVTFRFWKSATDTAAASRLYTETQLVTILNGDFSVLIGSGTTVIGEVKPAMATVFANKDVFLGITVDDGNDSTTDVEVTPRQQLVSTAFAFRASVAESVASASDLTLTPLSGTASNYGLGWYGTGRLFNSFAVDGPVLYGNAGGALGSSASGSQKLALSWDASGRVGIGATSITSATNKLTLQGDMATTPADQLTIRGNTDNNKRLLLGYDTTNNKASLQSYTAASTVGTLLLNPSGGSVGIGTTAAGPPLTFAPTTGAKISLYGAVGSHEGIGIQAGLLQIYTSGSTSDIAFGYGSSGAMTETMRIKGNGNIGIGTATPGFPLNFANVLGDKIALWGSSGNTYGFGVQGSLLQIHTDASGGDIAFGYGSSAAMTETMRIKGNGNVGIGTTAPINAKLFVNGVSPNAPYSIWATNSIVSSGHITVSDERIKNIQGRSDRAKDLETLLGIEVTDYRYKDVSGNGNTPQKKVIAQQVEKVFPQAVSRTTYVVPDIYQKASLKGAWISLESDLKVGDRVRLTSEKLEGIFAVLEVAKGKFRTEFSAETDEVFVYGREVSDFRVVDYDAISMLNVSATQELKREVDVLRAETARLRNVLEARLSALEQGRSEGATEPVSASQR